MSSFERIYTLSRALQTTKFKQLVLFLHLAYFVFTRKVFRISKPFTLNFVFSGFSFTYTMFTNVDFASLEEMFVFEEYKIQDKFIPSTIIDLGAHTGDSVLYFRSRYADAKIIAVEPDPRTFKKLQTNTQQLDNIILIEAAVTNHDGDIDFFSNGASSLGSSSKSRGEQEQHIIVKSLSLETLFKALKINKADLVKFDIEGGEQDLFSSFDFRDRANNFIGEVHSDLTNLSKESVYKYFEGFKVEFDDINNSRFIVRARRFNHEI